MKLRDSRIASAVLAGQKLAEIALSENVSERQIHRILARPEVRAVLDEAAREQVRSAARVLLRGADSAAKALIALTDGSAPTTPTARVQAATKVIELGQRAIEIDDVMRRLAELEALAAEAARQPNAPGARLRGDTQ